VGTVICDTFAGASTATAINAFVTGLIGAGSQYSASVTTAAANSCVASYAMSVGLETFTPLAGYSATSTRQGTTLLKAAGALWSGSAPNTGASVLGGFSNGTLAGAIANVAISQNASAPFCTC